MVSLFDRVQRAIQLEQERQGGATEDTVQCFIIRNQPNLSLISIGDKRSKKEAIQSKNYRFAPYFGGHVLGRQPG